MTSKTYRLAGLFVAGAAFLLAGTSTASAQGDYRDRGERYSRAMEQDSRARTRSADNTRFERTRATEAVRSASFDRGRSSFDDRYRVTRDRFDSRHDSRSRLSVGFSARSYNTDYHYVPRYRTDYHRADYYRPYKPVYEPVYRYQPVYRYEPVYHYQPTYHPVYRPVTHVTYSTTYYSHRPALIDCTPRYSYGHYYPRYSYPRSGASISFGIRYDYRR